MAKFQNTTGFNQVVILQGKKRLVRKEGVIEAHEEFKQTGFNRVPDDTPLTVRAPRQVASDGDLQELREKIEELEDRLNTDETISQIEQKIQEVSAQALDLGEGASKDLVELRDLVDKLNDSVSNQGTVLKSVKDEQETVLRRQEILKTAMQAMEFQVDELTGYEDSDQGN